VRGASLIHERVDHRGNLKEPSSHMWFVSEAFVQAPWLFRRFRWQFIVHELLYLYTKYKGTRQNLPSCFGPAASRF
jgi:hypothetical protein